MFFKMKMIKMLKIKNDSYFVAMKCLFLDDSCYFFLLDVICILFMVL